MCEVLDKAIERGKVEGQVIGMVKAYAEMNFSVEEIAAKTSLSVEEIERILENGRNWKWLALKPQSNQVMKIFNGLAAEGEFVEELQREVDRVKSSEEWRREYMTLQILLDDTKKDAYSEGLAKGQADTLVRMVCKKLQKGKSLSEIAEELETTEDEISRIVEIAKRYEPEYDMEAICKELTNR